MLGVVHFSSSSIACCTWENYGVVIEGSRVTSGLVLCDQAMLGLLLQGENHMQDDIMGLDYLGEGMHLGEVEAGFG